MAILCAGQRWIGSSPTVCWPLLASLEAWNYVLIDPLDDRYVGLSAGLFQSTHTLG